MSEPMNEQVYELQRQIACISDLLTDDEKRRLNTAWADARHPNDATNIFTDVVSEPSNAPSVFTQMGLDDPVPEFMNTLDRMCHTAAETKPTERPKIARFGIVWSVSAMQEVALPTDINADDKDEVRDYIQSIWDEIALPTDGDYIPDSDELDDLIDIEVY